VFGFRIGQRRGFELQTRPEAIIESSDAIISKDLDAIVWSWNRGAERLFGYTAEEMCASIFRPPAAPGREMKFPISSIDSGGVSDLSIYETKRRPKSERILTISLTVSPIRVSSGTIVGASKVARYHQARAARGSDS
jgi:PAS domain S-box-containing protein